MALLFKMAAINTKTAITQANKIRFRRLIGQNSQEGKLYRLHNFFCLSTSKMAYEIKKRAKFK